MLSVSRPVVEFVPGWNSTKTVVWMPQLKVPFTELLADAAG
jgi:hypothetical protein